jgi:hypothetical protein
MAMHDGNAEKSRAVRQRINDAASRMNPERSGIGVSRVCQGNQKFPINQSDDMRPHLNGTHN